MTPVPMWAWAVTLAVIAVLIVADLILTRGPESSLRAAAIESALWLGAALAFGAVLWLWRGPATGSQYLAGVPARKSPQRGQRLRVRAAVRLHADTARTAEADPVPRRGRRARAPRRVHRGRRRAHRERQLDLLRVRRHGAAGRGAHVPGRRGRVGRQPRRARPAPGAARHRALRRRTAPHPGERPGHGHPPARGAGGHRGNRRGVRARLDPGCVRRDQGPVRGVHVQRLRRPRPAGAVLPAGGFGGPVRLPQAGYCPTAGVHRREDAPVRRGAHAGMGESGGDRGGRGGRDRGERVA